MPLLKALLVGLHELQFLRKAKQNSTRVALAGQQQQTFLRRFLNVLMNSFPTSDRLQPERLQMSSRYIRKCEQHGHLCYIQNCVLDGFHEAWPTITKQCGKRCAQICSPVKRLVVSRIVTEDGSWHQHWTADRKTAGRTVSPNTSLHKDSFSGKSHDHCFFWNEGRLRGVSGRHYATWSKH